MKIKINTKVIRALQPCTDRLVHWLNHYPTFSGDIQEFLQLEHITAADKVWVALRVLPRFLVEVFAIDCAVVAAPYTAVTEYYNTPAAYASYAIDPYYHAYYDYATSAAYAAAKASPLGLNYPDYRGQVAALSYLISTTTEAFCEAHQ